MMLYRTSRESPHRPTPDEPTARVTAAKYRNAVSSSKPAMFSARILLSV